MTRRKIPEFAQIIVQQLGGAGTLRAFAGVDQFVYNDTVERWLQFNFKGSPKANRLKVILEPDDTYTLEFWQIPRLLDGGAAEPILCQRDTLIYCDQLIPCFEEFTGLFLSFYSHLQPS